MTPANGKTTGTIQPQTITKADLDTRPTRNTCAIVIAFMTPANGKTTGTIQLQTFEKADLGSTMPTRNTWFDGIIVVVFITHANASTNREVGTTTS